MNSDESIDTEKLLKAWEVRPTDLTARIGAAIGDGSHAPELLDEVRALRRELDEVRRTMVLLQAELIRAREEAPRRMSGRFAPYVPTESLIRLS